MNALFNIGYGLYVVTSNDGVRDNGLILNSIMQVTSSPERVAVAINKNNYSHDVIKKSGIMTVNCLSVDAPFKVFEAFGFVSGREKNKFEGCEPLRAANGLVVLPKYINAYIALSVVDYIDLGTHGLFICDVTEKEVVSDRETMTYTYYQKHVKPKPKAEKKRGYICTVCGFIHDENELPEDFVCPICGHGASDFEELIG